MSKQFKWNEECLCLVLVINSHQEIEKDVGGGEFNEFFILFLLL
jgi:hypothetical protein